MELSEKQIERYSRQIVLKEIGGMGQKKLMNSLVTIIGLGGLGSPAAYYLVAAGIGKLKLVDFDYVELSNLQRQILHFSEDISKRKTISSLEKLNSLNPDCSIEIINKKVSLYNIREILQNSDFVIEGSDNFATKMLVNDACVYLKIPFTIAGTIRFHGQLLTVVPEKKTTCYRCVFGNVKQLDDRMSCSQAGVIGVIPGIMGSIEANEAIKYLLDIGELITNKMLFVDLLKNNFSFIDVYSEISCIVCGENPKNYREIERYGSDITSH